MDELREIYYHLNANKLRTTLTGLSVSVGIFLLILLLGAGNGLINAYTHNQGYTALNIIEVIADRASLPYKGLPEGRKIQLLNGDLTKVEHNFPSRVKRAIGIVSSNNNITLSHTGKRMNGSMLGVSPELCHIDKIRILHGRFINAADIHERRKSVVIGAKTAREFYPSAKEALGKTLSIDGIIYRIVGIEDDNGVFHSVQVYTPFTTTQLLYKQGNNLGSIKLRTNNVTTKEDNETFGKDIRRVLASIHHFDTKDENAIYTHNMMVGQESAKKAHHYLTLALWFIGLLTLLSGIAGVSNIMLITVKERTREIGIRKALGARPWSILKSILLESIIITSIFGYFGLMIGIIALKYLAHTAGEQYVKIYGNTVYTFLHPYVGLDVAIEALLVLIVAGIVAGMVPAHKAILMKPIDALRAEK